MTKVKICGLKKAQDAHVAADGGADFLGFVHFSPSPRHVDILAAVQLGQDLPVGPARVGVVVDASLEDVQRFAEALALDYLQLHGPHTPPELAAIRDITGLKIIKALGVSTLEDIALAASYGEVVDMLLFDAKPPAGSTRPGGNAVSFDATLTRHYKGSLPWLLAGGLTPDTVAAAIAQSGAPAVDVASGVEEAQGIKSHALIKAFLQAAKGAS